MKILLIDDVYLERLHLSIRLKKIGHEVSLLSSGIEIKEKIEYFEPDLILMDINMPDINGIDLTKWIRRKFKEWIPIIFLSSYQQPNIIEKAIIAGGDDYLIKPVNRTVLASKILAMERIAIMRTKLKNKNMQIEEMNSRLQKQANEDPLTGLFNRRFLNHKVVEFFNIHERNQLTFVLIMIDVDYFKKYNDFYGHIKGDQCLTLIANELNLLFSRKDDIVARFGGEEFIILLGNTNLEQGINQCQRIKEHFRKLNISHEKSFLDKRLTLSQGLICVDPNIIIDSNIIYNLVDIKLYEAKKNGRNTYAY